MRATRSSLKEWPLRDGLRPPGVGGSGARRVVGEKSRVSIAADGACARDGLQAYVCIVCVRECVFLCVYVYEYVRMCVCAWKTVEEQRETMTETGDPAGR